MKLFLTANRFLNTPLEKDFLELVGDRTNLKVAIIPTAGDPIEWIPESEGGKVYKAKLLPNKSEESIGWLESYKGGWEKRGHSVVFVDLKEDGDEIKKKLESVDVIDVGGGDVNWLLDWAKKSKFSEYLKSLLLKGVVYTGSSAGSMLVNPDIGFTWWGPEEKWEGMDHVGLGIVDFIFQPLHGGNDEEKTKNLIERKKHLQSLVDYPWKIYLVGDGQAIKVNGDKIEHIGEGLKKSI
ncbi:MAG: Type 1 glutamine amidotransferase-like domain-containing protein [Parcubacteria group bacterium]|nr:Type 1 glutamine amidotransferase-like domain-containing protein [Parcubacteria group bacterium]